MSQRSKIFFNIFSKNCGAFLSFCQLKIEKSCWRLIVRWGGWWWSHLVRVWIRFPFGRCPSDRFVSHALIIRTSWSWLIVTSRFQIKRRKQQKVWIYCNCWPSPVKLVPCVKIKMIKCKVEYCIIWITVDFHIYTYLHIYQGKYLTVNDILLWAHS